MLQVDHEPVYSPDPHLKNTVVKNSEKKNPYQSIFLKASSGLSMPMIEINNLASDESPDVILSTATGHSLSDAGGPLPECSIGDI
ncbi:unnamed protein product, partial [Didymodactylos carnosus]